MDLKTETTAEEILSLNRYDHESKLLICSERGLNGEREKEILENV